MLATELEFVAPTELEEALSALAEPGAKPLAGGMSLVPLLNLGTARPAKVVSLSRLAELRSVTDDGDAVRVGAAVTHAELASDGLVREACPVLANTAGLLADVQVRNRGTIGGSLAHAQPGAEYLTLLSALDGEVAVRSASTERMVRVRELVVGANRTVLDPADLIVSVRVPKVPPGNAAYIRYARVQGNFSTINAAALLHDGAGVVAIGGALPTPVVFSLDESAEEACRDAYDDPVATAEYRRAMAGVFARRVVELARAQPSAAVKA
jgi:aerobic carbon-monoxide dehydrogenase medium subunit